jgi:UDP-glucose 4-epimerase
LEDGAYATVVGIFEKQYREGKPLTVTGDGEQRRDFTHIDDIVDGLVRCGLSLLTDSKVADGQAYELGRGKNYSINEITEMFGQTEVKYIPARKGEYPFTLADYTKASEELGWKPSLDIKNYISK